MRSKSRPGVNKDRPAQVSVRAALACQGTESHTLDHSPRQALQRRRLGAAFGAAAPVQAYARLPVSRQKPDHWDAGVDLRVSDDGKLALADGTHRFWATSELIDQSDSALRNLGSPFMFNVGSGTLVGKAPAAGGAMMRLNAVVPVNLDDGTQADAMRTIEACSSHGQHLIGAGLNQGPHHMARGMAVVAGTGANESERRYDKRGSGGQGRTDTRVMGDLRAEVTGVARDEAEEAYGEMNPADKTERARALGINQFAEPQVGEALAVYAAVEKLKAGSFPMHFAGVVARSGPDHVTLENYAKAPGRDRKPGDMDLSSNDWTVKMYGPVKDKDDQSFYGELASNTDYGGRAGVMVLKHRAVQGYDEPQPVRDAKPLLAACTAFGQGVSMAAYPAFTAAWIAFRKALQAAHAELANAWIQERAPDPAVFVLLDQRAHDLAATDAARALLAQGAPVPEVQQDQPQNQPQNQNQPQGQPDHQPDHQPLHPPAK